MLADLKLLMKSLELELFEDGKKWPSLPSVSMFESIEDHREPAWFPISAPAYESKNNIQTQWVAIAIMHRSITYTDPSMHVAEDYNPLTGWSVHGLASFPGLHAQLLSLAVWKAWEGLEGFITWCVPLTHPCWRYYFRNCS